MCIIIIVCDSFLINYLKCIIEILRLFLLSLVYTVTEFAIAIMGKVTHAYKLPVVFEQTIAFNRIIYLALQRSTYRLKFVWRGSKLFRMKYPVLAF